MPPVTQTQPALATKAIAPTSQGWALAALALSTLLASLGVSIANVALPTLADAFSASFQETQWVILSYLLAITVLIVSVGRLGDFMGRRRVLLVGLSLFTTASILCGAAPTLGLLIVARAAQGLGAAILMALTIAFVSEIVPKTKTGSAMGLLGTMSAIGTALGPTLGGALIAGAGWRAIFLIMAPLGLLNILLAYRHLPRQAPAPQSQGSRFDGWGTLLLGATLASYALAMTMGRGQFGGLNVALLAAAAIGVGLFLRSQAVTASPLIRLELFRKPGLSASLAVNALVSTVMMATLVVGPFYLARSLGLSAALVGAAMSVGPVLSALTGVPSGKIVDKFGASGMVVFGLVQMALGALALALAPAKFGALGYIAAMAVLTPGYALFQAANNTAVMKDVASDQRGVISGLLSLSRNLGLITGAAAMGAVFSLASGTTAIAEASPEAIAQGMRATFILAGGLVLAAAAIALGNHSRGSRTPPRL